MNPPSRKKPKISPARDNPLPTTGGKRGCLAWVLTMPLDIVLEIFGHLTPPDLILLARMKAFRRTLMHKSAISVWRTALSKVPGLPDKPPDMCEPAWANLVFDRHCHYCGCKNVRKIHWRVRLRLCAPCTRKYIVKLKSRGPNGIRDLSWEVKVHRRILMVTLIPAQFTGTHFVYLQENYEDAIAAMKNVPSEEREKYIAETQAKMLEIDKHAALCEVWASLLSENFAEELKENRVTRLQQIKHKLKVLGYDIDAMDPRHVLAFEKLPLVKQNQPLTPRVWRRIKRPLLAWLEAKKNKSKQPPKIPHQLISPERKQFALAVMRRYWDSTVLDSQSLAITNWQEASSVIHGLVQSPTPVEIEEESLKDHIVGILLGLFDEWRATLRDRLLDQMEHSAQCSDTFAFKEIQWRTSGPAREELLRRLFLATTVFTCGCSDIDFVRLPGLPWKSVRSGPPTIKPLFYPNQVLGHICLHRTPELENHWTGSSLVLNSFRASRGYPGPQAWDCSSLRLNSALGDMVERLIRLTPLDPETATVLDMDRLGVHFACINCAVQDVEQIELYMTTAFDWREAIRHEHTTHTPEHCHVSWKLLGADELEAGRQDGEDGWPAEFRLDSETWLCMVCNQFLPEVMDLGKILRHLRDQHEILEPVRNRDYYKDFSAPACGYEHKQPHGVGVGLFFGMRNLRTA